LSSSGYIIGWAGPADPTSPSHARPTTEVQRSRNQWSVMTEQRSKGREEAGGRNRALIKGQHCCAGGGSRPYSPRRGGTGDRRRGRRGGCAWPAQFIEPICCVFIITLTTPHRPRIAQGHPSTAREYYWLVHGGLLTEFASSASRFDPGPLACARKTMGLCFYGATTTNSREPEEDVGDKRDRSSRSGGPRRPARRIRGNVVPTGIP